MLALTQKACDKYVHNLKENGLLLVDSTNVLNIPSIPGNIYQHPITKDAIDVLGNQLVANVISLGILVQLTNIVSKDAIKNALQKRIPERIRDLNKRALDHGFQIGENIVKE